MRIAQLAPPYLPVPPKGYGGTERIVHHLTEGLVAAGHDVTLFAAGDSVTKANLSSTFPKAIGNSGFKKFDALEPLLQYSECYARADGFDIIHSHGQYLSLFGARNLACPVVFTWHGSFYEDEVPEEKRQTLRAFRDLPIVSISNNQRLALPELNYAATVYNSIDVPFYRFFPKSGGDYLLWIGRMSPKKGALEAIRVAEKAGIRLEIAAALDPVDRPFFEEQIKPKIDGDRVIYHGELSHDALVELYGGAIATLYPISWHEPFGLVMAESMACGTPVITFDIGSSAEVVEDGVTGYVVAPEAGVDAMVSAVKRIGEIDRKACRARVEKRFGTERMVAEYEAVYRSIVSHHAV